MYIDTHCHITRDDYSDIPFLIDKIKNSGVNRIIVNGCDMESNLEVLELVKKYDIVYGSLGFHPTELDGYIVILKDRVISLIIDNDCIIIESNKEAD